MTVTLISIDQKKLKKIADTLRLAKEALESVNPFYYITGNDGIPKKYCHWCHVIGEVAGEYRHAPGCLRQRTIEALKELE